MISYEISIWTDPQGNHLSQYYQSIYTHSSTSIQQRNFVSWIHGSYIKTWSIMIRWLTLLSCMQRIMFSANGVMLFNKDVLWSTRQYEPILRMNRAKRGAKILAYKEPSNTHNINYRGIQNLLMNANIFDNRESRRRQIE